MCLERFGKGYFIRRKAGGLERLVGGRKVGVAGIVIGVQLLVFEFEERDTITRAFAVSGSEDERIGGFEGGFFFTTEGEEDGEEKSAFFITRVCFLIQTAGVSLRVGCFEKSFFQR
ncbi:MAG: hypothetical protein IPM98_18845 [Lewinellaceae bacterium]|nr:hypothetical protein [Lewinellaceae bacterium]